MQRAQLTILTVSGGYRALVLLRGSARGSEDARVVASREIASPRTFRGVHQYSNVLEKFTLNENCTR